MDKQNDKQRVDVLSDIGFSFRMSKDFNGKFVDMYGRDVNSLVNTTNAILLYDLGNVGVYSNSGIKTWDAVNGLRLNLLYFHDMNEFSSDAKKIYKVYNLSPSQGMLDAYDAYDDFYTGNLAYSIGLYFTNIYAMFNSDYKKSEEYKNIKKIFPKGNTRLLLIEWLGLKNTLSDLVEEEYEYLPKCGDEGITKIIQEAAEGIKKLVKINDFEKFINEANDIGSKLDGSIWSIDLFKLEAMKHSQLEIDENFKWVFIVMQVLSNFNIYAGLEVKRAAENPSKELKSIIEYYDDWKARVEYTLFLPDDDVDKQVFSWMEYPKGFHKPKFE